MKREHIKDLEIGDTIDLNDPKLKTDPYKLEPIGVAKIEMKDNKIVAETTYFDKDK